MDVRPNGGRGGGWKRGGRGGNSSDSFGGEHRGRGRGGQHRGRGKRDHYRGRGRGGSGRPADFHHRDRDEGDDFQERDDSMEVFSRRKLESNWDRYTASERREPDDDTPTHRGADYQVLLESAGDSFTQFRFSDEKDWEVDSSAAEQMSAVFVDLAALAQSLQQVPLHQRLNLEAELVQVSTPVQLPTTTLTPKQEIPKAASLTPLSAASKILGTDQTVPMATNPVSVSVSQASSSAVVPPVDDDGDEELDQLLGLQEPVSVHQLISDADEESVVPEEGACEEVKEAVAKVIEQKMEKVIDEDVTSAPARQEMTEEDLEDWLDSMIS